MNKTNIIAIIPARGGSKGIPRKNIRFLGGKPLIAHTITEALKSRYIDRVVVSTEDEEIAGIAKEYGAEVLGRPIGLASDSTPTEAVLEYVIKYLKWEGGYEVDVVVLLQPTSPLRNIRHIDAAVETFFINKYDSLLSVCYSDVFLWRVNDQDPHPLNYDFKNRLRRQDREPEYRENGAIYITKGHILINENNRLGGKIGLYVMPEESSLDINSEFDFWLCEQLVPNTEGI